MKKVYKLLAFIFVSSIIVFGAILIVYRQNIFEYLNSINDLGRSTETAISDIQNGKEASADILNLAIINDPKFKKMQLTEVDLTGLNIGTSTQIGGGTEPGQTGPIPAFEVGNSNPFKAF